MVASTGSAQSRSVGAAEDEANEMPLSPSLLLTISRCLSRLLKWHDVATATRCSAPARVCLHQINACWPHPTLVQGQRAPKGTPHGQSPFGTQSPRDARPMAHVKAKARTARD